VTDVSKGTPKIKIVSQVEKIFGRNNKIDNTMLRIAYTNWQETKNEFFLYTSWENTLMLDQVNQI